MKHRRHRKPGLDRLRKVAGALAASILFSSSASLPVWGQSNSGASPPPWAYPLNLPELPRAPDGTARLTVPHSDRSFLRPEVTDRFYVPDWHPEEHPPMPTVVALGQKPDIFACGYCHLPDGAGRPENASLAGLPAAYIKEQLADFRSGARKTAVPERSPPVSMIALTRAMTAAQIETAAKYFSKLPRHNRTDVLEASSVPGTYATGWFLTFDPAAKSEPIGQRIIEVPEVLEQFERRDSRSRILAYVPPGSIKAGRALVRSQGNPLACANCHGATLNGRGLIPGIAGRSPSYIVRQLYDIQTGARNGAGVTPMKAVVKNLTVDDMVSIAAYLVSLN
jgi:cytochrome c553